jgi:hypothetical protein
MPVGKTQQLSLPSQRASVPDEAFRFGEVGVVVAEEDGRVAGLVHVLESSHEEGIGIVSRDEVFTDEEETVGGVDLDAAHGDGQDRGAGANIAKLSCAADVVPFLMS